MSLRMQMHRLRENMEIPKSNLSFQPTKWKWLRNSFLEMDQFMELSLSSIYPET